MHVGVARIGRHQRLQLLARRGQLLVDHQQARVAQPDVARLGVLAQETGEPRLGLGGRAALQKLRLEQRRRLPVGLEFGGLANLHEGQRLVIGKGGRLGDRETRLRQLGVARGEFAHHREIGRAV